MRCGSYWGELNFWCRVQQNGLGMRQSSMQSFALLGSYCFSELRFGVGPHCFPPMLRVTCRGVAPQLPLWSGVLGGGVASTANPRHVFERRCAGIDT
jgi:hypothetical protein